MVVCFSSLKRLKHKTLPFVANEKKKIASLKIIHIK